MMEVIAELEELVVEQQVEVKIAQVVNLISQRMVLSVVILHGQNLGLIVQL
jgi:hypothetical protein